MILGPELVANFGKATLLVFGHESHWGAMAAFTVAVTLLAFIAGMGPPGWRLAAWSSVVVVTVSAVVSMAFRYDASALGVSHAIAALLWAGGFGATVLIVGAHDPDRIPLRRRGEGLVAGVATAVARRTGWKVGWVRAAFAIPLIGGAAYGVLWLALPIEGEAARRRSRYRLAVFFVLAGVVSLGAGSGGAGLLLTLALLVLMFSIGLRPVIAVLRRRLRIGTAAAQIAATIGLSAALLAVTVLSLIDDLGAPVVPHRIESESFSYCASCHAPPRVLPGLPIPEPGTNRGAPVHENIIVHSGGELCVSCHSHLPRIRTEHLGRIVAAPADGGFPMSTLRVAARVATGVAALAVVVVGVAAFVAYFTANPRVLLVDQGPLSLQPAAAEELGLFFDGAFIRNGQIAVHLIGVLTFWLTGLLILLRGGTSPMRVTTSLTLLLLGAALFSPLSVLGSGWSDAASVIGTLRPGPVLWRSAAGIAMLLFALVFPDGRPLGRAWSWALLGFAVHVAAWSIFPGSVIDPREWSVAAATAWTIVPALAATAALIVRYGRVEEVRRPQIRLVVVAFSATVATILAFWSLQPRLEEGLFDLVLATRRLEALHDLNLLLLLTISLLLLPVAVGVSVVRYRLWDMGLLVNRAIVYGALTAMVAAPFLVGMVGVGSLLTGRVGNGRGVAGVVTGVALVLVFQPVRRRVQAAVDRRFYREKYDADRAVDHFARVVTDLVDAQSVADAIDVVLRDTVHPTDSWIVLDDAIGLSSGTEPVDRTDRNLGRTPCPNCGPMEPCSPSRSSPRAGPWGPCFSDHGVRVGHTPHSIDAHWKGLRGRLLLRCASASWSKRRSVRLSKRPASTARWRWRERFSATCCRNSFRRLQAGDSPPATSRRERSAATTTTSSPSMTDASAYSLLTSRERGCQQPW